MNTDLTPRININTAPETVLQALEAALSGSSTDATGAAGGTDAATAPRRTRRRKSPTKTFR